MVKIYSENEIYLLDRWEDYAHTLEPESLAPEALKEVAKIRLEKKLDAINLDLIKEIKKQYGLNWYGTHGIIHWHRVYINGIRLSEQEAVNKRVVQLFSIFHDSCRKNENQDPDHGRRGAELAVKLRKYFPLDDAEFSLLATACKLHTDTRNHENITVQACFDADRLDLGRVGIRPDPDRLCTPLAKKQKIIEWGYRRSLEDNELPYQPFGLDGYWDVRGMIEEK